MESLFLFLKNYLVTFIYAIGLIYFIYGFIEYFLIGKHGDEERMQNGREILLKACAWFFLGLIIYGVIAAAQWLSAGFAAKVDSGGDIQIEHQKNDSYLPVPNVPRR